MKNGIAEQLKPIQIVDRTVLRPEQTSVPTFPLEALGPVLGQAAERLRYHVQTPAGMAGQSVLAAAALAVQGCVDVQRGPIGMGPVSLFCLTVAESGDRKSTIDRLALSPIRRLEQERREALPAALSNYKASFEAWEMRRNSIVNGSNLKKKGAISASQQEEVRAKLLGLDLDKPRPPSRPNLTFEEPTAEGIYRHLQESDPTAGLFSDEAVGFFGGHGMSDDNRGRTIASLSKLWDGSPISRTRGAIGESGILAGRRLSAHLMLQPVIAAKVLGDPVLLGQGFLARFLICHEASIAGTRFLKGRDVSQGPQQDPAICDYWDVLATIMRRPLDVDKATGELRPRLARIEGPAFHDWCALHDGIERHLAEDGRFTDVKPFASKAADNAARIATILALVEGYDHPQAEHIKRAGALIAYYLESMALRTQESQQEINTLHALDLFDWISARSGELKAEDFKRLPKAYRNAVKARSLLVYLVKMGRVEVIAENQNNKPSAWRIRGS